MENRGFIQRRISEADFDKPEQFTDEKIEYNNGPILYFLSTSQRHNDIISNIDDETILQKTGLAVQEVKQLR